LVVVVVVVELIHSAEEHQAAEVQVVIDQEAWQ